MSSARCWNPLFPGVWAALALSWTPSLHAQVVYSCPAGQELRFYVEAGNQYQPGAVGSFDVDLVEVDNAALAATPPGSACAGGDEDDKWIVGSNIMGRNDALPESEAVIPIGYTLEYVSQCFAFVDGQPWGPSTKHVSFVRGTWFPICEPHEFYVFLSLQNPEPDCVGSKPPPSFVAKRFYHRNVMEENDIFGILMVDQSYLDWIFHPESCR
jgi:hypothetical protein